MTETFRPGDYVRKFAGDYQASGTVLAVFDVAPGGPVRIVVRHAADVGWILHTYSPAQLRLLRPAAESAGPVAPALPDWVPDFLNRRTEVESALRAAAAGKRPPPTRAECAGLANLLSVPRQEA